MASGVAGRNAAYYAANREKCKAATAKWLKANLDKVAGYRKATKAAGRDFCFTYLGGACQYLGCGITDRDVLEFHHRDPAKKAFDIGNRVDGSRERLIVELKKCDLLCANHHLKIEKEKPWLRS